MSKTAKDQKQAAEKKHWEAFQVWAEKKYGPNFQAFIENANPLGTSKACWIGATERMQDENAKLREVIENLERQCNSAEVLIESARSNLDSQYAVDWHSSYHHYTEATKRAKEYRDKLKRKASLDQREAEGDGDMPEYDGVKCTCNTGCATSCKGECGCKRCRMEFQDFGYDEH